MTGSLFELAEAAEMRGDDTEAVSHLLQATESDDSEIRLHASRLLFAMYSYMNDAWNAALWYDRAFYTRPDYQPPVEHLDNPPLCVKIEADLGHALFHVTRIPPTPELEICQTERQGREAMTIDRLRPILERSGYKVCEPRKPFFCAATLSVLKFGTTKPLQQRGWLKPNPESLARYRTILESYPRPWVGLSWTGGAGGAGGGYENSYWVGVKTLPPEIVQVLDHGTIFDLQHETHEDHHAPAAMMRAAFEAAGRPMVRPQCFDPVAGLDDATGLLASLDYVVNTDNSNAYLCAALGVPVFVLFACAISREWADQRWWESACRIRGNSPGDWSPVLADLRKRIAVARPGGAVRTATPGARSAVSPAA